MRIVCQSCAAAYAIDDRHVTPRGVRAQCPRCKHLQLVRRDEPGGAPAAAAPTPAASPALPPVPQASAATRPVERVPAKAPSAAAAPAPPRPRPPTAEQPAAQVELLDLAVACERCGRRLEDPVEQALGTCNACREQAAGGASDAAPEGAGTPSQLRISLKTPAPRLAPPPAPLEPRSERGLPIAPLTSQRAHRPRRRWPLVVALGAGVLVLGGVAVYTLRERERQQREAAREKPLPEPVQAVLPRWRQLQPGVQGGVEAQLVEGQRLLARDERAAYAQAEAAFQRALLLDPKSDAAIAGYVQALALGRGEALEEQPYAEALALVRAAESRQRTTPREQLAHAALLQTRPGAQEQQEARQLAEEVLGRTSAEPAEKAEAHRVLGHGFAKSSLGLAEQHFSAALALEPGLVRVHRERAIAAEAAGDYRLAIRALEQRLSADPGHRESLEALARMCLEVGETERARTLYQAQARSYPNELRAQVPLAVLRYQVDGEAAGAATALRALLRDRAGQPPAEVAGALVHLAAAERAAGHPQQAERAAQEALGVAPELAEAHLQAFLVALERRDAAAAEAHLGPARAGLVDASLGQVLLGRLQLLQAAPGKALESFQEAYRLDARRTDALLLAGVAAAGAGRRDDAARVLFQALQADPLRPMPRPTVTRFYLQPHDTLRGTEGALSTLAAGPDDAQALLYEGLLRFHLGALADADRLLQRALVQDPGNVPALAYRALAALEREGPRRARPLAERAAQQGRRVALAQLALGMVLAAQEQGEPAQRALREALALSPSLLSAEVRLAQLEAGAAVDSARTRLLRVVGLDPAYLAAKRALFALEQ